jgi:hypothetical protein
LIEHAGFLHRVDHGYLETELLDRLDDTRIVMKRVDEENATTGMRDESLLSDLIEVPFTDATKRKGSQ